jgi:hypothetical protein
MKRIIFLCFVALLTLSSCGSMGRVFYDDSVPVEETAVIIPGGGVHINSFNGNDISWYIGTFVPTRVVIPAGEHRLTVAINYNTGYIVYSGGKLGFVYDFKPGCEYIISLKEFKNAREVVVRIKNRDTGKSDLVNANVFNTALFQMLNEAD